MIVLLSFIAVTVFLLGLYQWASGGAALWRIFSLRKMEKNLPHEQVINTEREVQKLQDTADRTITASFKIIAGLAVMVWLFLGLQMLLELFGINMLRSISTTAKAYWAQPQATSNSNSPTQMRNDMLRNMGSNLRR